MADVYVNALTTISTEPTTTDSLVAVNRNTNEGKIIDYNLLADAILNKITSKQFSGLTTTSKLLTGAINELDSDVSSLNSSSSGTNGSVSYIKLGKVVEIIIFSSAISEYDKWITLGTLPNGYRPIKALYFVGYDNSANTSTQQKVAMEMQITTTGLVQVWPLSANSAPRGSTLFISAS